MILSCVENISLCRIIFKSTGLSHQNEMRNFPTKMTYKLLDQVSRVVQTSFCICRIWIWQWYQHQYCNWYWYWFWCRIWYLDRIGIWFRLRHSKFIGYRNYWDAWRHRFHGLRLGKPHGGSGAGVGIGNLYLI